MERCNFLLWSALSNISQRELRSNQGLRRKVSLLSRILAGEKKTKMKIRESKKIYQFYYDQGGLL